MENGEFVVYVSDEVIIEDINEMVVSLDFDESEFICILFYFIESKIVLVFGIKEVCICFECILEWYMMFDND